MTRLLRPFDKPPVDTLEAEQTTVADGELTAEECVLQRWLELAEAALRKGKTEAVPDRDESKRSPN